MLDVKKYSKNGDSSGTYTLPETLFAVESNNPQALLYEVIHMYLANQRHGTVSTQTRGEANGSSKKLFRQKGTGNARPGNLRTPLRVGGGRAFGPKPRDWYRKIPKKKKRLALKLALTERANCNSVIIIEDLVFDKPNTKAALQLITKIATDKRKKLILTDGTDQNVLKSFSNLKDVKMNRADSTYAYEILNCNCLIITEKALARMEEVFVK